MDKKINIFMPYIILMLGITAFWLTAYPTITWWDTSEYASAAVCFGITGAPGSIIMTVFGWLSIKIIPLNPAHVLNLLAGLIGSLTIFSSFLLFRKLNRLHSINNPDLSIIENIGLILTSLIIIFSYSLWDYSTMFTPYILTALFTNLILLAVFNWWKNVESKNSWKNIFLITLILGIDFSVHRTNAVLIPGIIIIMLIRNYKFIYSLKSYIAAFSGIIVGLAIQLLYIPMSLRDPMMNLGETNNLQRWWDFISLKQYGGGFLLDVIVRKGPFWTYQIPYYFERFADQFFYFNHSTIIFGFVPTILGILGILYFFKLNKKLGWALLSFFIITIAVSIVYFNLPEHYFRTIYRHYLPTFIIFSVFIFSGVIYLFQAFSQLNGKQKLIFTSILFVALILTFYAQLNRNIAIRNNSKNWIAYNHAKNILNSVDKDGILINNWDNNIWPELYIQIGENYRSDITQCNSSLSNLDWYIKQLQRHDKKFPFIGKGVDITKYDYPKWKTIGCEIELDSIVQEKYNTAKNRLYFSLPPIRNDSSVWLQDIVLFDIIKNNRWNRPIYFIKQGFGDELEEWLKPYLIDEGLVYKLSPDSLVKTNINAIENNIIAYNLSGYNNNSIYLDDVSIGAGNLYYVPFLKLINDKIQKNDIEASKKYYNQMIDKLPINRLNPNKDIMEEIDKIKEKI
jgi:hypothetical protein